MTWITLVWAMMAAASFTFAAVHLSIFAKHRHGGRLANLIFVAMAISIGFIAPAELGMMHARTPDEFAFAQRWFHVPLFVLIVSIVVFVRVRFGAGRIWLAYAICGLRAILLIPNFTSGSSLNYKEILGLRYIEIWGGEMIAVADAVTNPWTRLAALSLIMLLCYVLDATYTHLRRSGPEVRRRVIAVGGGIMLAIVGSGAHATLVHEGLVHGPYLVTPAFMLILAGIAYELGSEVVRAGHLAVALDVSESARRESEKRMQLATSAAALGFWEWKLRPDDVWFSKEACAMMGLAPTEQFDFTRFMSQVHPDDRDEIDHSVQSAVRGRTEFEGEFRVLGADGETRWLNARGRVEPSEAGDTQMMRGILFDITERKRLEFDLAQQRNELAHLSRVTMLGELSGSLAHELNQPLAAILSNAQAAQRVLARTPDDQEQLREILADIVEDDKRAGEVISRLRLLLKKDELSHEPLDLKEVVEDVLRLMRSDFLNREVAVRETYATDVPEVYGDRVQLQQVFLNLFMNASDAMDGVARPQKIIEVALVAGEKGYVEVRVIDQGKGIPKEDLERIFEPFVTTKPHGMGLGLSVCQTIVAVHGGQLWATNNSEHGATMHLALPMNSEKAQ